MDKKGLVRELKAQAGVCFPCVSDIARAMGTSRDYVRNNITCGLEWIGSETHKNYFVDDVAERILQLRSF